MPEIDLKGVIDRFQGLSGMTTPIVNPTPPPVRGGEMESIGINWQSVINPSDFYYRLVLSFLYVLGSITVIVLIYGGILYLSSGGDVEKAERGKKTIIGAIIGLIVIAAAYAGYNFMIGALTGGLT